MNKCFIILLLFIGLNSHAQNFRSPLDITLSMSANFGELRSDHFHSGIDYRVGGVVGAKVYAVEDGYVSRIYVNPSGYGKAIYITHPSGHTSVYGHLNAFAGNIASFTKETQYKKEHFTLDEYLEPSILRVKKGDVIGYAGNSGSSFGAHLHFEIRDSDTQAPMNTITKGFHKANDKTPPTLYNLAFYTLDTINDVLESRLVATKKLVKSGNSYNVEGNKAIKVTNPVYFGISALDFQENNHSKFGVYCIKAYIDNELFFTYKLDEFKFSETRYINSMIDYSEWVETKKHFVKTYIEPGNKLPIYKGTVGNGVIRLNDTLVHNVRFDLYDDNGNKSTLNYKIQRDKVSSRKVSSSANFLTVRWDLPFSYSEENIEINIPQESFYSNHFFKLKKGDEGTYSPSWTIMNDKIPLHQSIKISFRPNKLPITLYDKLIVVKEDKGKQISCGGNFDDKGKFTTSVRSLGTFALALDTIPPTIRLKAKGTNFTNAKTISLAIGDNLSGVAKFKGYIDGKWALFDYDAKTASLTYTFDSEKIKKGKKHKLEVIISDYCKNETKFTSDFTY